jgi:hypothetical protein
MARQRIDLDINTQRLLGANRDRAAANRSAFVDREERKRTAAKATGTEAPAATPGTPTQEDEPRGGTPDLYRPEEPAATRRKKKGVEVFAVETPSGTPYSLDRVIYVQGIETYQLRLLIDNPAPYTDPQTLEATTSSSTEVNRYALQTSSWRPEFLQKTSNNAIQYWLGPAHVVENHLLSFDWFFNQSSHVPYPPGYVDATETVATIPPLPIDLLETTVVNDEVYVKTDNTQVSRRSFTSCDGTYIYHSRLLRTVQPTQRLLLDRYGYNSFASIVEPGFYESYDYDLVLTGDRTLHYNSQKWSRRFLRTTLYGESFTGNSIPGSPYGETHSAYGLYWKFNARTKEPVSFESRLLTSDITTPNYQRRAESADLFFSTMEINDPIRRLYKETGAQTLTGALDEFFFYSYGTLKRWPPGLVYDEERGWLTLVTTPMDLDDPRIFSLKVGQIPYSFSAIPFFYLPDKLEPLTTIEDYEAMGWTLEDTIYEYDYGFPDHFFALKP